MIQKCFTNTYLLFFHKGSSYRFVNQHVDKKFDLLFSLLKEFENKFLSRKHKIR